MGHSAVFRMSRRKFIIAVVIAAAVLVLGVGTALAEVFSGSDSYSGDYNGLPFTCNVSWTYDDVTDIYTEHGSCHGEGVRVICEEIFGVESNDGWFVYRCVGESCTYQEGCKPISLPASLWLSDVCEPYYGGMYDQYGQITFGTDHGTTLYVGASYDGLWTAVEANGPPWVLTMSDMDALAASQGVASVGDLWFTASSGPGYAEPRLLSSMVADRAAKWGDDCTPVYGGPVSSEP